VAASAAEPPDIRLFFEAASRDEARARDALDRISRSWRDPYAALAVDLARLMPAPPRPATAPVESEAPAPPDGEARGAPRFGGDLPSDGAVVPDPRTRVRERLVRFLERLTGQAFGHDLRRWRLWIWKLPYEPHPDYAAFKAVLYAQIDPRMAEFFAPPGCLTRWPKSWSRGGSDQGRGRKSGS
jgi:hypothetical protein